MVFPATNLIWKIEFNLNTIWTDVTTYVLFDGGRGVTIRSGLGPEDIDGGQPSMTSFTMDDTSGDLDPDNTTSPFYPWLKLGMGVRTSYDTGSGGFSQRSQGEVYAYEPEDRPDGLKTIRINAVSSSKRVFGGARALVSPLRSTTVAARPVFYAALEDGAATLHPQVTYGSGRVNFPGAVTWGARSDLAGSKALPTLGPSGYFQAIWDNSQMSHQRWQVEFWLFIEAAPSGNVSMIRIYTDGSTPYIDYQFSATLVALVGVTQDGTTLWTTGTFSNAGEIGTWRRIRIMAQQNGANVDYQLTWMDPDGTNGSGISVSAAGTVGAAGTAARIGNQAGMSAAVSIGHFQAWDDYNFSASDIAGAAFEGEVAWQRWQRVMGEIGYTTSVVRTGSPSAILMGKQAADEPNRVLQECVDVSHGFVDTDKSGNIRFTDAYYMQDRVETGDSASMTVDYSQSTVYDLQTARHDTILWNEVDASMPSGSSVVAQRTTGRYRIDDPPDGIGRIPRPFTFNLDSDTDLPHHAGWELNRGTIDQPSVKALVIKFERKAAALAALLTTWKSRDTGDWIKVSNPPSRKGPDPFDVIMLGYEERGNQKELQVTIYGRPIADYHAHVIDTDERIDSDSTALLHALTTSDTSVRIYDSSMYYFPVTWAHDDGDYTVRFGGKAEDITVTAVSSGTPTFVSVGAAAHGDNASVVPTMPASIQKGDSLILVTAIRNQAAFAGAITNPGGWMILANMGNFVVLEQVWDGSFTAPTCGFAGGSAGDTTSAFLFAMRNVAPRVLGDPSTQSNASAANIAYPALSGQVVKRHKPAALLFTWKADDLTTASTPSGFTQIAAVSTTVGNDQSLTAYYQFQAEAADIASGTITITGGASAVSESILLAIDTNVQTLTVTRHVNGVQLAHLLGEEVHVKTPIVLSL